MVAQRILFSRPIVHIASPPFYGVSVRHFGGLLSLPVLVYAISIDGTLRGAYSWFHCVISWAVPVPVHHIGHPFWHLDLIQAAAHHGYLDLFFDFAGIGLLCYMVGCGCCLRYRFTFCIGRLLFVLSGFLNLSHLVNRNSVQDAVFMEESCVGLNIRCLTGPCILHMSLLYSFRANASAESDTNVAYGGCRRMDYILI